MSASSEGDKFALVVGINNSAYSSYLPALKYAERDADTTAQTLKKPECGFTLLEPPLIGKEAHTMAVKNAVTELISKGTDKDFLLFYFSGHAKQMNIEGNQEDVYFVTHDFEETKVKIMPDLHLSMSWLWKAFYQQAKAGRALLIIDCCYAGKMVNAGHNPYQIDIRKIVEDYLGESGTKGHQDRLRLMLMATGSDTTAQEQNGHGFMTDLLLQALQGEERDVLDDEGRINITSLVEYLRKGMQFQPPNLWMEGMNKTCILASYPQHSARLRREAEKAREDTLLSKLNEITDPNFFKKLTEANTTVHIQPFDQVICENASATDLSQKKVHEFFKRDRVQIQEDFLRRASDQDQLQHFELLQGTYPIYAALLCFGLKPTKWLAGASTRCIIWNGENRHSGWLEAQDFQRDLITQFELSRDFLRKYMRLIRTIGRDKRVEELEIPLVALGEALANALVHREYINQTSPVYVDIFDNRVEISSPGIPPEPMTLELLEEEHKSHPRNPQIARIFYLYGYVEKVGSGIQRIQHAMEEAGLPPAKFELGKDNTFKVVFYRPQNVSREMTIADELAELPTLVETANTINNPNLTVFHFNVPLSHPGEFYGRVRELETLIQRVATGGATSIVGPRRIGKTWLINYLMLVAPTKLGQRFRITYIDATTPACRTVDGFATTAIDSFGFSTRHSNQGLISLERVVSELKSKNYIPVICIDEFESLSHQKEFDLSFFSGLRALTQEGLVLVIASKSPLINIIGNDSPTSGFFNIFEQLILEPFNKREAGRFVQTKGSEAGFSDQEQNHLFEYGQIGVNEWSPLRLQLAGKMLLEDKNLAIQESPDYYRPDDQNYWQAFEERLVEKYRGVVR